ncbi:class I SAM-dependent methyltransferase [Slackia sp. CM382]|uniref:class I SAM-dependent methyltransferase n=1 Tax=Slackia sp. CM382 TaxID=1111137 RepID=UPI00192E565A|nr:class I SAM-dependent methyltransferase [Slackia sp. CM382]
MGSLKKSTWDRYAPIYERAMRSDESTYESMYARISEVVQGKEVLELATGPGLLAKHVVSSTKRMVATDYSEGMIREAKKGEVPGNLTFEVADATDLPYEDASFDVVIIANALHIMPNPERALSEARRVLRDGGLLIAPNFVSHDDTVVSRIWSWVLKRAGIGFDHQWTLDEYVAFLSDQGWRVVHRQELKARIALLYVECVRIR